MPVHAKKEQLGTVMEPLLFILNKLVTIGILRNHPNLSINLPVLFKNKRNITQKQYKSILFTFVCTYLNKKNAS
jgi:hypothetical protein